MNKSCLGFVMAVAIFLGGCNATPSAGVVASAESKDSCVLLSVTSDASVDPQSVDMAMKLAGFSLDEGRRVVVFFNVRGVTVPVNKLSDSLAFGEDRPIKTQLAELIERGVDVHVCPICMKALGLEESDLVEGAIVTTRPSLFANIGPNTSVFTY